MKQMYLYITLVALGCTLFLFMIQSSTYGFDPNATKYELVKIWGSKGTKMDSLTVPMIWISAMTKNIYIL